MGNSSSSNGGQSPNAPNNQIAIVNHFDLDEITDIYVYLFRVCADAIPYAETKRLHHDYQELDRAVKQYLMPIYESENININQDTETTWVDFKEKANKIKMYLQGKFNDNFFDKYYYQLLTSFIITNFDDNNLLFLPEG